MFPIIYEIENLCVGRLAIMGKPATGEYLEDDIVHFKHMGINLVVSLLEPDEQQELDLVREKELCLKHGLEFLFFPIKDREVPDSFKQTYNFILQLSEHLADGKMIAIHCRAGIGRSSLIAACLLIFTELESPDIIFERITSVRRVQVPDTEKQKQYVEDFFAFISQ